MLGLHKRASDFKVYFDTVVTSVPVSTLKWASTLCSFSVTVKGEVFSEFKTPRNAVSRLSSSHVFYFIYFLWLTSSLFISVQVLPGECSKQYKVIA